MSYCCEIRNTLVTSDNFCDYLIFAFLQSLSHCNIHVFRMQNLYPVSFATRNFLNRKHDIFEPIPPLKRGIENG